MKRVLVISPHPDDEAIGCGGTLRGHVVAGHAVRTVFLTSGEQGGHGRSPAETSRLRESEAEAAAAILGVERIDFWRQPDAALRATRPLVERMSRLLSEWRPAILYVPHGREMHADHRAARRICRRALSARSKPGPRPAVREFEIWTPIQQIDEVIDITAYVEVKRAAIQAHKSQCDIMRFDEASLGLGRFRGEMHSWPGGPYAEVFSSMRP